MSYTPLPDSEIAAVVTFLEMRSPPDWQVPKSNLSLRHIADPQLDDYRRLFRRIGCHWLWFSRLVMDDEELARIICDPAVEIFAITDEFGAEIGMLELDFRKDGECEIAFVGILPELAGRGHGRWILGETLRLAWRDGIQRVHVHTCTLDHPAALPAYRSAGFSPYKRAIEQFPDPRLLGVLPRACASQVPLLGTVTSSDSRPAS